METSKILLKKEIYEMSHLKKIQPISKVLISEDYDIVLEDIKKSSFNPPPPPIPSSIFPILRLLLFLCLHLRLFSCSRCYCLSFSPPPLLSPATVHMLQTRLTKSWAMRRGDVFIYYCDAVGDILSQSRSIVSRNMSTSGEARNVALPTSPTHMLTAFSSD